MGESLKAKTFANVGYNSIARVIALVFQAVANIILTRTLTAGDYGIVGFAMIFIGFLGQFSDLGIGSALIHRSELEEKALYTGFTVKFFMGIIICLAAWVVAPLATMLFDNTAVVDVIRILSLSFFINSFMFLPNILLTKELDYKNISIYSTLTVLFQSTVAIILALKGFKFWSIVIANVSAAVLTVVVVNIMKPIKLKFMFNRAIADQLINYGGNLFFSGFIVFIIFNIDNFMIGSVAGSDQLGYYALAFGWGSMMCSLMSSTVLSVFFPTLSKMEGNRERIKNAYLKILEYVSFVGILANMTLFVIAKDFLVLILGHDTYKWLPSLTVLKILLIYGVIRMLLEPIGSVAMTIDRIDKIRNANIVAATIELLLIYPVLKTYNIEGVAILVTLAYVAQYFICYRLMRQEFGLTFKELVPSVIPSIASAVVAMGIFIFIDFGNQQSVAIMFLKASIFVSGYIVIHGVITRWKIFKETFHNMFPRARAQ